MKKLVALLLAVVLVLGLMTGALAADGELAGKTVILHTNDVHGAIGLYAKVAALKKDYAEKGADVILVDAGDYIQGTPYVSDSQGKTAIELMNAAGYDVATFGQCIFCRLIDKCPLRQRNGLPRPVSGVLPLAGQRVEERALADVRVARQRDQAAFACPVRHAHGSVRIRTASLFRIAITAPRTA